MLATLLVLFAFALRIVPHPPNFAPIGATAVFAGRTLPMWAALVAVFAGHLLSNCVLAAQQGYAVVSDQTMFVWLGFAAQVWLGKTLRARRGGALAAATLGSMVFFVTSNFGVWVGGMYGRDLPGLVACFVAAIPFYPATLASDLIYTIVLLLAYRPLAQRFEALGSRWVPVPSHEMSRS